MNRTAIVVAMEREILPLVRDWTKVEFTVDGQSFTAYEQGELVALAGGIGCKRAENAASAAVKKYWPDTLISAGLAGALIRSLKPGNILLPSVITDAETGEEYRCDAADELVTGGVLVSASEVADGDAKSKLVENFHALVVDMEAAGVARAARAYGVRLRCVKAISDEFDFPMPPLGRFIDKDGNVESARFARWVAVHPQYWKAAVRLARNSRRATAALTGWLRKNLASKLTNERVATLDTADHIKT